MKGTSSLKRIATVFALVFFVVHGAFSQNPQLPDNIQTANCTFTPQATQWGIVEDWSSTVNVSTLVIPLVGDINGDGVPEIVCFAPSGSDFYNVNTVLVFNSLTHEVIHTFTLPGNVSTVDAAPYGIVKLHNGHVLFAVCAQNNTMYGYDLTAQATTPAWSVTTGFPAPNVGFADFNADGYPEIYVGNKIFDAENGTLLVTDASVTNFGGSYAHTGSHKLPSPCVANLTGDTHPELILGNEVYAITITNRNGTSGNSMTLSASCTPPSGIAVDGHPQVADFNLDGYLDVFISNKSTSSATMGCYVWDVHNNTVSNALSVSQSGTGKSIPLIANIDNDEALEMVIQSNCSGNKVQAYKYNQTTQSFSLLWSQAVDEDSYSNGATTFDFNHDGEMEVLLSDQSTIKILNGENGNLLTQLSFGECTVMQYPIIADVDADGNAEIAICGQFGAGHTNSGHLVIFCSSTVPWAPARKVWNQYMYNVTNVNQDLSVPAYIYNNASPFTDPQGVIRRPFNNFLQQATTLDQYGRPFYGVPDAAAISATVTNNGSYAVLDVTYVNQGDAVLNAPYSITVFANQVGGTVLHTIQINEPLRQGQTITQSLQIPISVLCNMSNLNNLIVAINCAGGGIGQDGGQQAECDITNNTTQVPFSMILEPTNIYETACDEFVWHGVTYTHSGQYPYTYENPSGCDSTVILNLTIYNSVTYNINHEACDSYNWYGQTYTQSGTYSHTLQTAHGCDSTLVLNLAIYHSMTQDLYVETCDNYSWYGHTYSQSGTYEHHLQTVAGCDSLLVLHLTIGEAYHSEITVEACDLYHWRGQDYTQSGTYTQTVQVPDDCDSTFVLHLNLNFSDVGLFEVTVCDEYTWFGETYTESGVYEHLLQTSAGCDSLLILTLTVGEAFSTEETESACNSFTWHGNTYTESGTYTDVIPGTAGCDSTFVLHLTIGHDVVADTIAAVCQQFTWYGTTYYESGEYTHHLNTTLGCDSLVVLHLDIGDISVISEEVTACDSYTWRGQTYTEGGQYSETVENPNGCDTIFRLNLRMGYAATGDTVAMTCEPFVWYGNTYTQSGDYEHMMYTPYGCDSLVTLHFTIGDAMLHPAEVEETCNASFDWRGHTYTQSGVYYDTVTDLAGCDDIYMLDLTLNHTPQLTLNGPDVVTAATNIMSGIHYYWVTDSLAIEPNVLEWNCTNPDWEVTPLGNRYRCRLWVPSIGEGTLIAKYPLACDTVVSIDIKATWYDVEEQESLSILMFPNPARTKVTVQAEDINHIRIIDAMGQVLLDEAYKKQDVATLGIGHLPQGIYMVEITTAMGKSTRRLVVTR